jgi:hypothetical protein
MAGKNFSSRGRNVAGFTMQTGRPTIWVPSSGATGWYTKPLKWRPDFLIAKSLRGAPILLPIQDKQRSRELKVTHSDGGDNSSIGARSM